MTVKLRPGRAEDAEPCGVICYEGFKAIAERHGFPPDLPTREAGIGLIEYILGRQDAYSVVAERGGRVIGSNFLWVDHAVAGIGPITIDPAEQDGGVGRALMEDVIAEGRRQGCAAIRLVQAAYHNRSLSLYTKLGFDVREPLALMQGGPLGLALTGFPVRTARGEDLAKCNALCRRVHGHERGVDTRIAIQDGAATVVERNGRITGYATQIGLFGHAVGESDEDLKALIGAAGEFTGPGFLLPTRNAELFRWSLARGLRVVMPLTLMSMGLYSEPAAPFLPSILY